MKQAETLSVMEKTLVLSEWKLFERLATDDVALIAARTREVTYEAGETVTPDDPTGNSVHFVLTGAIELAVEGRVIRTARAGDAVGSIGVLGGEPTAESLRVIEPAHALVRQPVTARLGLDLAQGEGATAWQRY